MVARKGLSCWTNEEINSWVNQGRFFLRWEGVYRRVRCHTQLFCQEKVISCTILLAGEIGGGWGSQKIVRTLLLKLLSCNDLVFKLLWNMYPPQTVTQQHRCLLVKLRRLLWTACSPLFVLQTPGFTAAEAESILFTNIQSPPPRIGPGCSPWCFLNKRHLTISSIWPPDCLNFSSNERTPGCLLPGEACSKQGTFFGQVFPLGLLSPQWQHLSAQSISFHSAESPLSTAHRSI